MAIEFKWFEVERLMELRGIKSREKLAVKAGIHGQNLYKIATGQNHPSLTTLGKLCHVLVCQPGDLLSYQRIDGKHLTYLYPPPITQGHTRP